MCIKIVIEIVLTRFLLQLICSIPTIEFRTKTTNLYAINYLNVQCRDIISHDEYSSEKSSFSFISRVIIIFVYSFAVPTPQVSM